MPQVLPTTQAQPLRQAQHLRLSSAPAAPEPRHDTTSSSFAEKLSSHATEAPKPPAHADKSTPRDEAHPQTQDQHTTTADEQPVDTDEPVATGDVDAAPEPEADAPDSIADDAQRPDLQSAQPVIPEELTVKKPASQPSTPAAPILEQAATAVAEPEAPPESGDQPQVPATPARRSPTSASRLTNRTTPTPTPETATTDPRVPSLPTNPAEAGLPQPLTQTVAEPGQSTPNAPVEPATTAAQQPASEAAAPPIKKPEADQPDAAKQTKRSTIESAFKLVADAPTQSAPASGSPNSAATPLTPGSLAGVRSAASAPKSAASAPNAQASPAADSAQAAAVRGLSAAVQQRGGSVTIRLSPESLGNLKIEMSLERGIVSVNLRAATPEAHELLSQSLGTLRSSLEARGLSVERLNVQLAPAPQPNSGTSAGGDQQPGMREDPRTSTGHDAGGGASRGRDDSNQHQAHGGATPDADVPEDASPFPAAFASTFRLALDAVA